VEETFLQLATFRPFNAFRFRSLLMKKSLRLDAMAIEIPDVAGHPNRVPFSGVLTLVDRPSDRAPAGAAGHRVLLPRSVAERALPSLLGMAVDFAPGLRGHDVRRKIGIITRAEIVEDRLEVAGYFFGKDFPDVIRELRALRHRLGMSYEVTGVRVADWTQPVWRLERVVFTGAAILEREAAAYEETSLAAHSAKDRSDFSKQGDTMNDKLSKTLELIAQSQQSLAAELSSFRAVVEELRATQQAIAERLAQPAVLATRAAAPAPPPPARKTVPPQVMTLLAKSGVSLESIDAGGAFAVGVLDRALEGLPVEQRMAVKSQLARAGAL
jgi:hypothetical protein